MCESLDLRKVCCESRFDLCFTFSFDSKAQGLRQRTNSTNRGVSRKDPVGASIFFFLELRCARVCGSCGGWRRRGGQLGQLTREVSLVAGAARVCGACGSLLRRLDEARQAVRRGRRLDETRRMLAYADVC